MITVSSEAVYYVVVIASICGNKKSELIEFGFAPLSGP